MSCLRAAVSGFVKISKTWIPAVEMGARTPTNHSHHCNEGVWGALTEGSRPSQDGATIISLSAIKQHNSIRLDYTAISLGSCQRRPNKMKLQTLFRFLFMSTGTRNSSLANTGQVVCKQFVRHSVKDWRRETIVGLGLHGVKTNAVHHLGRFT